MRTLFNVDETQHSNFEIRTCYNASDCVGDEIEFCNHDADTWGYCMKCSKVVRFCTDEEFLCERGLISCNETCGGTHGLIACGNI